MKEKVYSERTKRWYAPSECIRILNIKQILFYLEHNIEILDFYPSKDFKTGDSILVFLVKKEDTHDVYKLWKERLEGIKNKYGL